MESTKWQYYLQWIQQLVFSVFTFVELQLQNIYMHYSVVKQQNKSLLYFL